METKEEKLSKIDEEVTEEEITQIKRFLLTNGFNQMTIGVVDSIARLAAKSAADPDFVIEKAYEALAPRNVNKDTYRAKLGYYVKRNFDNVRKSILTKYGYNIGDYYSGVKAFVDQIAAVHSVFVQSV